MNNTFAHGMVIMNVSEIKIVTHPYSTLVFALQDVADIMNSVK